MSSWPRLVNLRRCARGQLNDAGESTNTTLSLFNNSASSELILLWQLSEAFPNGGSFQMSYQQARPYSTAGVVAAIVPGDAPPPGLLTQGDDPNVYTPDWAPAGMSQGFYWPATFPLAVLQPGWALVAQPVGGGTGAIGLVYFWEAIIPKLFDRFYTHQLLEIELALKG